MILLESIRQHIGVFLKCNQDPEEGIGIYVIELKTRTFTCNFGDITDSCIREDHKMQKVQKLIGAANYLSTICAHPSEACKHLRQLKHKKKALEWVEAQKQALERIKKLISEAQILKYYNSAE